MKTLHSSGDKNTDISQILKNGGMFTRLFGPTLFKAIDKPYKMYFVGFLFGLGFDTATEIALLSISVIQSAKGVSPWLILALPILFTCGMTLVDTADGITIVQVYGYALISPVKKLAYNLFITTVSSIFAITVGCLAIFGIFQSVYELEGSFWDGILFLNQNFTGIGIILLLTLPIGWGFAAIIYSLIKRVPALSHIDSDGALDEVTTDDEKIEQGPISFSL